MAGSVTWPDAAQGIGAIVQAVAILLGGGWAYFKFIHGRTFAYRAELDVQSSFIPGTGEMAALHVCVTFRNIGLSQIPLSKNVKQIYTYATRGDDWNTARNVDWGDYLKLTPVFEEQKSIEAQEIVTDDVLVPVPLPVRTASARAWGRRAGGERRCNGRLRLSSFRNRKMRGRPIRCRTAGGISASRRRSD
jgi:hypothetical protein